MSAQLERLAALLHGFAGIGHKADIAQVVRTLATDHANRGGAWAARIGDDCAAIPDGDGYLLLAIEGFVNEFVAREPWFAGYCGVMVNVSDIYAMGGRPLAVVDALWSRDGDAAQPLLDGLAAASAVYQVPIVGGHSNRRSDREQLSVAITGRAHKLLTSFDARPGENLVVAYDLRGRYLDPYHYWNASLDAPPERLRADLELLPAIAEAGLCRAAKDISMAGVVGTALMLLECSGIGADIDLAAIPRPAGVALERWLTSFPSYGFILSVADADLAAVLQRFQRRALACGVIGRTNDSRALRLRHGSDDSLLFWDFTQQALIGCAPQEVQHA
ncbi:sll0787 family AIR synthase-like protein [Duganella sp. FT94W]|uniref:Sll0787 family AIR synthase-like protein n=1 Tax=Duganella lactea TaxID=2692173 RepID=A0ABW9V2X7_9BURK|nr:sll0787 family AIR synthase-like protein [Duganella lactea]MYM33286.1 sll0787 family AIR synthase-like protein [Duganella lactea]